MEVAGQRPGGFRSGVREGIEDRDSTVVLAGVEVFGPETVATCPEGGGNDTGVPVGNLEALLDVEGIADKGRSVGDHRPSEEVIDQCR